MKRPALGLLLLALSGCAAGNPASAITAVPTTPPAKMRVAWVSRAPIYTTTLIANEVYYKEEGLDVDLQYVEGSGRVAAAMVGGDVDAALMSGEAAITADVQGGADLVMVGGTGDHTAEELVGLPDVKTPADLKGKIIGLTQGGISAQLHLQEALKPYGMTLNDVTITFLGGAPAIIAALQSKQIDAGVMTTDNAGQAVKQGQHIVIDIEAMHLPSANSPLIVRKTYLNSHRDELTRFLKAQAQGIKRLKTDKAFAIEVIKKYFRLEDPTDIENSYTYATKLVRDDLLLTPDTVQAILDSNQITGHKPDEFMDMSLVQTLNDSGFISQLWKS